MIRYLGLYGVLFLLIQGVAACGPAQNAPQDDIRPVTEAKATDDMVQVDHLVIAFGDSLYAGYRLGPKEGFALQLQARLREDGFSVRILNAGVSGDTSAAGRARLSFVLDNAPQKVDLVILGLGGNDMLRGIKPVETRANMVAMLDELRRRKIDFILTGMLAAPNLGADYAGEFNPIFPALAGKYNVPLYPFFLDGVVGNADLMLSDDIHPNGQGVAKIVDGMFPMVKQRLRMQENAR